MALFFRIVQRGIVPIPKAKKVVTFLLLKCNGISLSTIPKQETFMPSKPVDLLKSLYIVLILYVESFYLGTAVPDSTNQSKSKIMGKLRIRDINSMECTESFSRCMAVASAVNWCCRITAGMRSLHNNLKSLEKNWNFYLQKQLTIYQKLAVWQP